MKKNILQILLLIFIYNINISFWLEEDTSSYSYKNWFELYKQRNINICNKYLYKNNNINYEKSRLIIEHLNLFDYLQINKNIKYNFNTIRKNHSSNMNKIYKCSILSTKEIVLKNLKNDLLKNNPSILKKIEQKIKNEIIKIRLIKSKFNCNTDNKNDSLIKLKVLKQSTYQTCKYINYLEYLKEHINKLSFLLNRNQWEYNINNLSNLRIKKIQQINDEIKHIYYIFPNVYHAYTEFENNISIHFLLQLLKEDYLVFRETLHKTLNPINQVVYKIINAMKK